MAAHFQISVKTLKKIIKKLKEKNIIKFVGDNPKWGEWQVNKK